MTPAQQWGAVLRHTMTKRGMSRQALADEVGCSVGAVSLWVNDRSLPDHELGMLAAEVLVSPRLGTLLRKLRTKLCIRCERPFIAGRGGKLYCSAQCRSHAHWRKSTAARSEQLRERNGRELAIWRDIGQRMCLEWCPNDGLCPDASCPIQEMDKCPLPLARMRVA